VRIPFNRPTLVGGELDLLQQVIESGRLSGDGAFTRKCQALLEEVLGVEKALLTTSCTQALELACLLLDLKPGDEVILPSFTFVSTANAFALRGVKPVFCDVDPRDLNLDPDHAARLITPRTRALVPVHYGGVGCDMDRLGALAEEHQLSIVEDNAHGLFGNYHGRPLGTIGALATLSFHDTKNFTSGEGGVLLINDPALVPRAEILWHKGTNRSRFFRGEIDKYTWVDLGSSYTPSEFTAALLYGQLEAREAVQGARERLWRRYRSELAEWAAAQGVALPPAPEDRLPAYHLFFLVMPTPEAQARLIAELKERGIQSVFHYQPLHSSAMGQRLGGKPGDCPVTERVSASLVRLPFFTSLSESDQSEVIEAVTSFKC
jgi:dTDP-4-amino-4,6-dideoxygalactose transaminase